MESLNRIKTAGPDRRCEGLRGWGRNGVGPGIAHLSVPDDIGQRFLRDAEEYGLNQPIQSPGGAGNIERHLEALGLTILIENEVQGRYQTEIVQVGRPEVA